MPPKLLRRAPEQNIVADQALGCQCRRYGPLAACKPLLTAILPGAFRAARTLSPIDPA